MGGEAFTYRAFGLRIRSEVELDELHPAPASDPADPDGADGATEVVVRVGAVPDALDEVAGEGVLFQAAPGRLRLEVPGVARFLVRDGTEVVVDPEDGRVDKDVRLFLYGSVFAAALQQLGVLTLHASAVSDGERALVVAGRSGHGKSTLAASLTARGYALISDDLVAIRRDPTGRAVVAPGYPWLKLWAEAVSQLGIGAHGLTRVRDEIDKSYVPAPSAPVDARLPIAHLFVLHPHNEPDFEVREITGMGKITLLRRNTHRHQFLEGMGALPSHFEACAALANQVDITTVARPRKGFRVDDLCDLVLARAGWSR